MSSYLQDLTVRLATGVGLLPEALRQKHIDFIKRAQREDGGFAGRMGDSDLYYTAFGLRAFSILGELYGEPAERAAEFLRKEMNNHQTIVDFFSLFYASQLLRVSAGIDIFSAAESAWQDQVVDLLNSLRRDDGGFAKAPQGNASSTYHSFLVLLVMQLIEKPVSEPEKIVEYLYSQEQEDGGFREIRAGKRAGTNPTAAAIGTLRILDQLTEESKELTIDFLLDMQTDEGGLRANTRIPIADVLSTFTGLLTLDDLGAMHELHLDPLQRYLDSLQLEDGGFFAAVWDEAADVEYTFYGLGCLALLANHLAEANQSSATTD